MITLCPQYVTTLFHYNFHTQESILITFGTNFTEKTDNQKVLYFCSAKIIQIYPCTLKLQQDKAVTFLGTQCTPTIFRVNHGTVTEATDQLFAKLAYFPPSLKLKLGEPGSKRSIKTSQRYFTEENKSN